MKVFLIKGDINMIIETEGFKISEINARPEISFVHFGASKIQAEFYSNWKIIEGIDIDELRYNPFILSFTYQNNPICIHTECGGTVAVRVDSFRLFYEVENGLYMYRYLGHYASDSRSIPVLECIEEMPFNEPKPFSETKLDFIGAKDSKFEAKGDLSASLGIINNSDLVVRLKSKTCT